MLGTLAHSSNGQDFRPDLEEKLADFLLDRPRETLAIRVAASTDSTI